MSEQDTPLTADGVPFVIGMPLFVLIGDRIREVDTTGCELELFEGVWVISKTGKMGTQFNLNYYSSKQALLDNLAEVDAKKIEWERKRRAERLEYLRQYG